MMMTMCIVITLIIAYACIYLAASLYIAIGERRFRFDRSPHAMPMVSVVLCARNEERNLPRCLDSLAALDYPRELIEIIIVDDESTDRTNEICARYIAADSRFRLISTAGTPRTLIGKQRPLNLGIESSNGEIIFGIDADVAVRPHWILAHVAAFDDKEVGIAGGTTRIDPSYKGLFAALQACDLTAKISIALGCAGHGFPLTIMGNNISFRRSSYDMFGGFTVMKPRIVEDLALMNAVTRKAGQKLGWASGPSGVADSTPEDKFSVFIEQRRRWLNEAGDMSCIGKFMIGLEFLMIVSLISSIIIAHWDPCPLIVNAVVWLTGNVMVIAANPGSTVRDIFMIPLFFFFQLFYATVIAFRNLFGSGKIVWKGREYF